MKALVQFHSEHKYLFMAYSQTWLKQLGRLVANRDRLPVEQVLEAYGQGLHALFARAPQRRSHVNVCQHLMGYFKKEMSAKEKQYVLELLAQYRAQQLPLSSVASVLKSWAIREENDYLLQQRYFARTACSLRCPRFGQRTRNGGVSDRAFEETKPKGDSIALWL